MLDKGIVIAGDIQINLLDIELLTIKIRLLVASVDRAREMGINWWSGDPLLSAGAKELESENKQLRERLARVEQALGVGPDDDEPVAHATAVGENAVARASTDNEKTTARATSDDKD